MSVSNVEKRPVYDCNHCRYQFSVTVQTVMENTKLPLWKWFLAAYLMCESKKGISANQLKRMLRISYKTAWHLCHRIRAAMGSIAENPLSGVVEVDETYMGGSTDGRRGKRSKGKKRRGRGTDKTMVVGAVQREGQIRLKVTPGRATKKTLHKFVEDHAGEAERVITDGYRGYRGIPGHEWIDKDKDGYVSAGGVNTQAIESVWSLFKRSVVGTYHNMSTKHLPAYLDEMEWRFNNRGNEYMFRDTMLAMLGCGPVPYQELIGN